MDNEGQIDYLVTLASYETPWRDRQPFLESRGYMLRPRYRPGWEPSWKEKNIPFYKTEDWIQLPMRPTVIDATRISDGKLVYIKVVSLNSTELEIATYFSSPELRQDPRNHCVPILDVLCNPDEPDICYMVMPFLKYIDEPEFETVENILDFGEQILEGLEFLHQHNIAHRDCAYKNIMMDPTVLYPKGFHPVHLELLPDVSDTAPVLCRTGRSVRYYFTDFGISSRFSSDATSTLVLGEDGLEDSVPELSDHIPYDPFKVDIFIIGTLFRKQFLQRFSNVDMLVPLVQRMTDPNPAVRPCASDALQRWRTMRKNVSRWNRMWRLKPRRESYIGGAVRDAFSLFSAALSASASSESGHGA